MVQNGISGSSVDGRPRTYSSSSDELFSEEVLIPDSDSPEKEPSTSEPLIPETFIVDTGARCTQKVIPPVEDPESGERNFSPDSGEECLSPDFCAGFPEPQEPEREEMRPQRDMLGPEPLAGIFVSGGIAGLERQHSC